MLVDKVREDLQQATKGRQEVRVAVLRMLLSALEYADKTGKGVGEAEELAAIKSEVKKRKEAIEIYEKAGEEQRAKREGEELAVLMEYMPVQVGEEEVRKVVERLLAEAGEGVNKGQLIGKAIAELGKDKVDGTLVARVVNEVVK